MLWNIKDIGFDKNKIIHQGNQFLIGHLKLGIRGTLDEYRKDQLVAVHLPLIYDQVGTSWREPINSFNPLYTAIKVNKKIVDTLTSDIVYHEQNLSLKDAVMSRKTTFNIDGIGITITSERFVSAFHDRIMVGKYSVTSDSDVTIEINTGIDLAIWDINGPHIEQVKTSANKQLYASGITHEKGYKLTCIKDVKFLDHVGHERNLILDDFVLSQKVIELKAHQTYLFEQFAVIGIDQDDDQLLHVLNQVKDQGFNKALKEHQKIWESKWKHADVIIQGDDEAQRALRYSIYHLLLLSPSVTEHASIPARGISGQTYKGAIFWDTEIFMLPFYLNTDLNSARSIIQYRIDSLEGARKKAQSYGFKGAFYAWESQDNGFDACTDYNVTDVFTKRLIRTYFKDKQIHISGDIVYALKSYIHRTDDYTILKQGGLEVILEVARFYLDYGHFNLLKNRFEVWDVMGPDEYHERVHNNAFTNQLVAMVFDEVMYYQSYFLSKKDSYFDSMVEKLKFKKELQMIGQIQDLIYQKEIGSDLIIEQFDGYFKLKDIEKQELLKQKIHPNEYLGGQGLAGDTKIIKQADVVTMLYLFKEKYNKEVMQANWHYYEPKTEHGSSLSASMYALVSCLIDNPEYAYPLFMKSATVDLTGDSKHYAGDIYIGGTHPAASGGAYMTAIYGFSGLTFEKEKLCLNPKLPDSFESISFTVLHMGKCYRVSVAKNHQEIEEIKE